MEDPNPGLDGASEGAEDLELIPEGDLPKDPPTEEGGDPLDDIKDPVARADAKKHRAIARRSEGKPDPEQKQTPPSQEYVTKADLYKTNERAAIKVAIADPEVKAAWKEIAPLYSPRRGKETSDDVLEDIKDAIILYKARNPVVETDDSADHLIVTPVTKSGGGSSDKTPPKVKDPPNFKLPTQPKDWYTTKK